MTTPSRTFLFLQGPCSPFFRRLAQKLKAEGHAVVRVHFASGDLAYWQQGNAYAYRGPLSQIGHFLEELYSRHGITDQVLFGDRRPVHLPAIEHARQRGIRTHVFEEGYFRPFRVTLEREGVNALSQLPKDPQWFREVGKRLPEPPQPKPFPAPFRIRATHDVLYHLAGAANPFLFPRYRNHAPFIAPVEYAGYLARFARLPLWRKRDAAAIQSLRKGQRRYFVALLQLAIDAQIRDHSDFADMLAFAKMVIGSFARYAPEDSWLVIKNHPLDMGLINYPKHIDRIASRHGVADRVLFLETGDVNALLAGASGAVTVNSTAGTEALYHGCPTLALGNAIYDLNGITFPGKLNQFWANGEPPDPELFRLFRRTVIQTTQVNGGFYSRPGIELATKNAIPKLLADPSPVEQWL